MVPYHLVVALVLGLSACKFPGSDSRVAQFGGNRSPVAVKFMQTSGLSNQYQLVIATPVPYTSLSFCEGTNPSGCGLGVMQFRHLPRPHYRAFNRNFFFLDNVLVTAQTHFAIGAANGMGSLLPRIIELRTNRRESRISCDDNRTLGTKDTVLEKCVLGSTSGETHLDTFRVFASSTGADMGLVVFLHGGGGSNFGLKKKYSLVNKDDESLGQSKPTLDQMRDELGDGDKFWENFVFLAIQAPRSETVERLSWRTTSPTADGADRRANVINTVVRSVVHAYNIDINKIYFVGQSGGADYLSGRFIPAHGDRYSGGFIMLCGGAIPELQDSGLRVVDRRWNLSYYATGAESQTRKELIIESARKFQKILPADAHISCAFEGVGSHCKFDTRSQPKIIKQEILKMLAKDAANTPGLETMIKCTRS